MKGLVKFFLMKENDYILGPGRIALLRLVCEQGSLRKAAQEMGMSYRWAWGRIKDAEKALGFPLLRHGEPTGGNAKTLSREALEIIEWYSRTEAEIARLLQQAEAEQPEFLKSVSKSSEKAPGSGPASTRS